VNAGMGAVARLTSRLPWLRWVETWGVSLASLVLGLLTLLVFRRGLPHVGWIVGYLLLLWLIFAALSEWRAALEDRGRHRVVGVGEYAMQSLYHGLLLFVLPAYYASATLTSVNVFFLGGVAAGALVTAVDPWYRTRGPGSTTGCSASRSSPRSTWRCLSWARARSSPSRAAPSSP